MIKIYVNLLQYNQTPTDVLEANSWVSEEDKKRMRAVRDLIKVPFYKILKHTQVRS